MILRRFQCGFAATESSFNKSGYRNARWAWGVGRFLHPCRPPETRTEPSAFSELWCPLTSPAPGRHRTHVIGGACLCRYLKLYYLLILNMFEKPSSQVSPAQPTGGRRRRAAEMDPDERRQRFLERNRAAASRCRQKRKLWVNSLEKKAEDLANMNVSLTVSVVFLGHAQTTNHKHSHFFSPWQYDMSEPAGNMCLPIVAIRVKSPCWGMKWHSWSSFSSPTKTALSL